MLGFLQRVAARGFVGEMGVGPGAAAARGVVGGGCGQQKSKNLLSLENTNSQITEIHAPGPLVGLGAAALDATACCGACEHIRLLCALHGAVFPGSPCTFCGAF